MRPFFNRFLSLVLPVTTLSILLAIGYFTLEYNLGKALKIGILTGFISGILFSLFLSVVLLVMGKARSSHSVKNDPAMGIKHDSDNTAIDKKFILLMDKVMAFDVLMHSIIDQQLGEVGKRDKKNGTMTIYTPEHSIDIVVQKLTKHSSEVKIKSDNYSDHVKAIINYTKCKEHSFLQY